MIFFRFARRSGLLFLEAAVLGALLLSNLAAAETPRQIDLFDGKSLEGWESSDFYKPGKVEVRDGMIVLNASEISGGMTGVTSTRKDLPSKDYQLCFEAMRIEGHDFFAAATFPVGDSFITLVNGGWGGTISGLSSIDGMDASENQTSHFIKYENGKWYRFRVRITDQVIRFWIDDKLIARVELEGHQIGTRIETDASRPLGFASWETTGAVREIQIRRLTPAEVTATNLKD